MLPSTFSSLKKQYLMLKKNYSTFLENAFKNNDFFIFSTSRRNKLRNKTWRFLGAFFDDVGDGMYEGAQNLK